MKTEPTAEEAKKTIESYQAYRSSLLRERQAILNNYKLTN